MFHLLLLCAHHHHDSTPLGRTFFRSGRSAEPLKYATTSEEENTWETPQRRRQSASKEREIRRDLMEKWNNFSLIDHKKLPF